MRQDALVSTKTLRRLHATLWLACVATYVAMFASHILAGGSDLWAMVKASVSALTVAVLGRIALSLLAQGNHAATPGSKGTSQTSTGSAQAGSLLDIVSLPDADPGANRRAAGAATSVAPQKVVAAGNR